MSRNGAHGTYTLGLLVQPPPQLFDVTLPASISNGFPAAGAGNLETTASQDEYRFTTASTGTLQLTFGGCGGSLGYYVTWKVVNSSGGTVASGSNCSASSVSSLAAGQYRVVVTRNGGYDTYTLGLSLA